MLAFREHIVAEHATLRAALRGLAVLSRRARRDGAELAGLRSATLDVIDLVLAHLAHEDAVVTQMDPREGWPEPRRARMRRDHAEQRALMANLGALLEDRTAEGQAVARIVDGFVTSLLRDMDEEERDLGVGDESAAAS